MNNYTSFFTQKEKKSYSLYIFNELSKIDLPENFISEKKHIKKDWLDYLDKLQKCESYHAILEEQKKTITITACNNYCICPICSSFKRFSLIEKIKPYYNAAVKLAKIGRFFLYEATATIKNSDDLSADYEKLRESWTNFCQMGRYRNGLNRSSGEAGKIIGSIMSIEVTWSKIELWHVHAHLFLICDRKLDFSIYDKEKANELYKKYGFGKVPKNLLDYCVKKKINNIPVSKLTEEWIKATNGSFNFYVVPFDNTKSIEGLQELIKYVTKISDLPIRQTFELWDKLAYKKRITTAGIFCKTRKKDFEKILSDYNFLDDFLEELKPIEKKIEYEEMTEIKFNAEFNDFVISEYDGIFNYNWYQSEEYKKCLSNRNKIIQLKKNQIKDLNENFDKNIMDPNIFINKKTQILNETKKRFSKNQNINKYIFSLKGDQALSNQ